MSMDDQYASMQNFRQLLLQFNESLRSSVADLKAQHENVSPHWQDQWRKEYDAIWTPFEQTMQRYITVEGPGYEEFLTMKSEALWRYLYGN
jgi:uncharacterized protein YukE